MPGGVRVQVRVRVCVSVRACACACVCVCACACACACACVRAGADALDSGQALFGLVQRLMLKGMHLLADCQGADIRARLRAVAQGSRRAALALRARIAGFGPVSTHAGHGRR